MNDKTALEDPTATTTARREAALGRLSHALPWAFAPLLCLLLASGCEEQHGSVERELEDLQQARANVANEVDSLRNDLQASKEEVRELEAKLARAKQGLTEEVVEERQELQEALKEAQSRTVEEVAEARELSHELRTQGPEARQELNKVQQLEARVDSTTPPPPAKTDRDKLFE